MKSRDGRIEGRTTGAGENVHLITAMGGSLVFTGKLVNVCTSSLKVGTTTLTYRWGESLEVAQSLRVSYRPIHAGRRRYLDLSGRNELNCFARGLSHVEWSQKFGFATLLVKPLPAASADFIHLCSGQQI